MKAKSNLSKQILGLVLGLALMLTYVPMTAFAADTMSDDIVILYTNDVHTYIDNPLSYDVIAAIKDDLQKEYKYVILADAGDHIQGTAYGSMDKGESIINLMNAAGYDVATLGNHEFDYRSKGLAKMLETAAESGDTVPELLVCNINWLGGVVAKQGLGKGRQKARAERRFVGAALVPHRPARNALPLGQRPRGE